MSNSAQRETAESTERHFRVRYILLTIGIFVPLLWAFIRIANVYPVAAWNVMTTAGGNLPREHYYFVLRGETVQGQVIDIPAVELTDALSSRNWGLAAAIATNSEFRLKSPHPANAPILQAAGSFENVPPAVRMPELLRAWGSIYNSRLPASSERRLKAIRLDAYKWPGQQYSNYDQFIQSWREEL